MAMFVQIFWFSAKLVRDGKIGAGDVVAVFLGVFDRNEHSG
jgi:ATP-binding cassette subfamily B (MDR/TAP) protein 1